jgi:hypothetical protein
MTLKVTHKYGTTASTPPTASDIDVGEIAINSADADLYTKDTAGEVQVFKSKFTQSGTGAVPRTIASKLSDVVSPLDFGVVVSSTEPSKAVADANTAALQACADANKPIILPQGTIWITGQVNFANNGIVRGYGQEKDTSYVGSVIRAHSGFDYSQGMVYASRWTILENFYVLGNATATTKAEMPAFGISNVNNQTKISGKNLYVEYCRKGHWLRQVQNSTWQACGASYCPESCFWIENCENCKFDHITTNQSTSFISCTDELTRNVVIINNLEDFSAATAQRSRNLYFIGGIHERGNDKPQHCLQQIGPANNLVFIGGEYGTGGYYSTMNFESAATFFSSFWSPGQGNSNAAMLITTVNGNVPRNPNAADDGGLYRLDTSNSFAPVSLEPGESAPGPLTNGYRPIANNNSLMTVQSKFYYGAGSQGRIDNMLVQNYEGNGVILDYNFSQITPLSAPATDSQGTATVISPNTATGTKGGIQISGSLNKNFDDGNNKPASGIRIGWATTDPAPASGWPAYMLGKCFMIEFVISDFNADTTGVIIRTESPGSAQTRRTLETVTGTGYHRIFAVAAGSDALYDRPNFYIVPDGANTRQLTLNFFRVTLLD